jgi:hypothetical protein
LNTTIPTTATALARSTAAMRCVASRPTAPLEPGGDRLGAGGVAPNRGGVDAGWLDTPRGGA